MSRILYKIFFLQVFVCIFLSVLFHVFMSLSSVSPYDVLLIQLQIQWLHDPEPPIARHSSHYDQTWFWHQFRDVTVIWNFQTGLWKLYAVPKSAFDAPIFPTHCSHLCCHERAGLERPSWSCSRARETEGRLRHSWWYKLPLFNPNPTMVVQTATIEFNPHFHGTNRHFCTQPHAHGTNKFSWWCKQAFLLNSHTGRTYRHFSVGANRLFDSFFMLVEQTASVLVVQTSFSTESPRC